MIGRTFLAASALIFFNSCGTSTAGHLPVSSLSTPTEVVGDSAIAFQATTNCNPDLTINYSPELDDGKYGEERGFFFHTGLFQFLKQDVVADGKSLNKVELPPGKYVMAQITCTKGAMEYKTPYNSTDIYGTFNVYPNRTTYIGKFDVSVRFKTGNFIITVEDNSEAVAESMAEKPGLIANELYKELMLVP